MATAFGVLPEKDYYCSMAGPAENDASQEIEVGAKQLTDGPTRDRVREVAARLYGQGFERKHVARMLVDHIVANKYFEDGTEKPLEQRLSQARTKLRHWEGDKAFRDMIWNLSVVKLDLQAPAILGGVAKKAKKGRVDAARLALEITKRHDPKSDAPPTQIALVVEGVPRPLRAKAITSTEVQHLAIEGDGVVMEDEDDEV